MATVYRIKKKGEPLSARKHSFLRHTLLWVPEEQGQEFTTMTEAILCAEMAGASGYEIVSIVRDESDPPTVLPTYDLGENGAG